MNEDFFRECEEDDVPFIDVSLMRVPRSSTQTSFCCDFSSEWEVAENEPCPGCGAC